MVDLEFKLRCDDMVVVGEFAMELVCLPPLGSLLYMHGVRFTVSDVITAFSLQKDEKLPILSGSVKVECSTSFEDDDAFTEALCTLVYGQIRFDEEVLELVEAEAGDCRNLPRSRHLRRETPQ